MTTSIDLGRIRPVAAGSWERGISYEILTIVRHDGASWLCVNKTTTEPIVGCTDWMLLAYDGLTYTVIDDVSNVESITIAGVPTYVILDDGTMWPIRHISIHPVENTSNWQFSVAAVLAELGLEKAEGSWTILYSRLDYVYTAPTAPAESFTVSGVAEDADVNGTYVPVEE